MVTYNFALRMEGANPAIPCRQEGDIDFAGAADAHAYALKVASIILDIIGASKVEIVVKQRPTDAVVCIVEQVA